MCKFPRHTSAQNYPVFPVSHTVKAQVQWSLAHYYMVPLYHSHFVSSLVFILSIPATLASTANPFWSQCHCTSCPVSSFSLIALWPDIHMTHFPFSLSDIWLPWHLSFISCLSWQLCLKSLLAIVNNVRMNMGMHVSLQDTDFNSFGYIAIPCSSFESLHTSIRNK